MSIYLKSCNLPILFRCCIIYFLFALPANVKLAQAQNNWVWQAGATASDETMDVVLDASGENLYACGYISGNAAFGMLTNTPLGLADVFVTRQDTLGAFQWALTGGGAGTDRAQAIALAPDGNLLVTGAYNGTATFGTTTLTSQGDFDIFLTKIDPNGNYLWATSYGGTGQDLAADVAVDDDGNIVVTGSFRGTTQIGGTSYSTLTNTITNSASSDLLVFKTDTVGALLWSKQGNGKFDNKGNAIAIGPNNAIYLTGQFSDTLTFGATYPNLGFNQGMLVELDGATGDVVWFNQLQAGQVAANDLVLNNNTLFVGGDFAGNLIVTGVGTGNFSSSYARSVFVLSLDLAGAVNWIEAAGSNSALEGTQIDVDATGSTYLAGTFKCGFEEYQDIYGEGRLLSVGFRDVFIAKFDATGQHEWIRQFGGQRDDFPRGMALIKTDDPALVGSFSGTMNFPSSNTWNTNATNTSDFFSNPVTTSAVCNDPSSIFYTRINASGAQDAFFARPIDLNRSLYNTFSYNPDNLICDSSQAEAVIMDGTLSFGDASATDSVEICGTLGLYANLFHHPAIFWGGGGGSPTTPITQEFDITWSDGTVGFFNPSANTGLYGMEAVSKDGCITLSDTIHITRYPSTQAFPQNNGASILFTTHPFGTSFLLFYDPNDTNVLTDFFAPNDPDISNYYVDPNGVITSDSAVVGAEGFYTLHTFAGDTMCTNSNVVYAFACDQPGECHPIIDGEIHFNDSSIDGQDSVNLCFGEQRLIRLYDSTSFANGVFDSLNVIVNWSTSPGASLNPPTTYFQHETIFRGFGTGPQTITAQMVDPVTMIPYDTITYEFFMTIPTRDTLTISGNQTLCPGDTTLLTVSGADSMGTIIVSGPSIIATNAANDSVWIDQPGTYVFTYEDSVLGCDLTASYTFVVSGPAAPSIQIQPSSGVICPNDSVLLIAPPGNSNYVWFDPAGAPFSNAQQVFVSAPGFYFFTLDDTSGCNLSSSTAFVDVYQPPSLQISSSPFLCPGTSIDLEIITPQTPDTIIWQAPLTGNSLIQTVTDPGTYSADVISCGITTTVSVAIQAADNLLGIFAPGGNVICTGDTVPLIAAGNLLDFAWQPNGETLQIIDVTEPGTYVVSGTNLEGCSVSDSIVIEPFLNPGTLGVQGDELICPGFPLTLTSNFPGIVIWSNDQGVPIDTAASFTIAGLTTATDFILTHVSNAGCVLGSDTFSIMLGAGVPRPSITGDSIVCVNNPISLTATSSVNGTVNWIGPNGATQTNPLVIPSAGLADTGWYESFVESGGCRSESDSIFVTVQTAPMVVVANDTALCEGDTLLLNAFGTFAAGSNWTGPNGFTSTKSNDSIFDISNLNVGTYVFQALSSGGCSATDTLEVMLLASVSFDLGPDRSICAGEELLLAGPSGLQSYLWQTGDTTENLLVTEAGVYTLTVFNGTCTASSSIEVNIEVCPTAVPNVFSPNGDGINDRFQLEPGSGELLDGSIFNRWGRIVYQYGSRNYWDGYSSDGNLVAEGTYHYVLQVEVNGEVQTITGVVTLLR